MVPKDQRDLTVDVTPIDQMIHHSYSCLQATVLGVAFRNTDLWNAGLDGELDSLFFTDKSWFYMSLGSRQKEGSDDLKVSYSSKAGKEQTLQKALISETPLQKEESHRTISNRK